MRKKVSVAMAAYNGEKYIKKQIESILKNLYDEDELIISVDPSNDMTIEFIKSFNDKRIQILEGPGKGLIHNFENAIRHTKNEIIFLSDQDDIWLPNKVERVIASFDDKKVKVVLHDARVVNKNLITLEESFFEYHHTRLGIINNIVRNNYIGCCMAFRSELKRAILPFPTSIPMHDQWIGIIGEIYGKNVLINDKLLLYRRHESNMSSITHSSLKQILKWRYQLIHALLYHCIKKSY